MEFQTQYITPDIKLSKFDGKIFKTEVMFEQHILVWFISGETKIVQNDATYIFRAGDLFLIPRNQLATIINYPKDGRSHQSVAMHLTKERLKNYFTKYAATDTPLPVQRLRIFSKHPLLESCMASLIPYFDLSAGLPENIADIKIEEAISILRAIDPEIDGMLADFEEPGKIDLSDFMERNFKFNMSMEKFGYLTGRSLSTFRRDFKKIFKKNPQEWLTEKRLELAHYELSEKQGKPSEVYFEVGFENLSHFSHAFKLRYGYSPSELVKSS
jgi:AraC-like DNA-binding protein